VTTSPSVTNKTFLDAIYSGGDPLPPGESFKKKNNFSTWGLLNTKKETPQMNLVVLQMLSISYFQVRVEKYPELTANIHEQGWQE
jgi:hypothetical protein